MGAPAPLSLLGGGTHREGRAPLVRHCQSEMLLKGALLDQQDGLECE